MKSTTFSRRIFIGSSLCVVSANVFATSSNKKLNLVEVQNDGQFFTAHELTILTDVAELMIPRTATPGATDAKVVPVLDGMMLTWAGTQTKSQFRSWIKQLDSVAREVSGKPYLKLPASEREALLVQLDKDAFDNKTSDISKNYRPLKKVIFHIYYSSEEANPDFRLIPGGYKGCLTSKELAEILERGYL